MLIVADSSALVALATCNALEFLTALYDDVKVPQAVYDEVTVSGKPEADSLAKFLEERIVVVDSTQFLLTAGGLGRGEIEAMLLYKNLAADYLLIDDRRARAIAESNQIRCVGALGILLLAKKQNLVSEIASLVETLRLSSLHYSPILLDKALQLAGERP
jgi:predicted nucleic acid-binding protein